MRSRQRAHQFSTANRWILTALFSAAAASGVIAQNLSFPGVRSESKSPDGRFVIKNSDSAGENPVHALTLVDSRNGSVIKIYEYRRHVGVLWSPTSVALVVNDYEGSNASHPVLFSAPWTNEFVDLREKLIGFLRSGRGAKSVLDNHHVYFSAKRWLSGDEILCQVTGYGDVDPKGITAQYVYKIGAGFRPYR